MDYPPIVVISFNRPDKLRDVLLSLQAQRDVAIEARRIHLFQDGAVNRYSRIRRADDAAVAECVSVFRSVFPAATVHEAGENIGICENFERAENFVFDELRADCAYFFEDDLVLSPAYVKMLDLMRAKARNIGNIAYFAAYGDTYDPPGPDDPRRTAIIPLDHHWGFGLFARHRARIRAEIQPYLDLVMGADYARRDHHGVYAMYERMGSCPRGSSQDAAKAHACARLGYWRCNSAAAFARYAGAQGAHMNKDLFERMGFSRVEPVEAPIFDLAWPEPPEVAAFVSQQRALFRDVAAREIDDLRRALGRYLNPMRMLTREDIETAYRLLLGRSPEAETIFERHAGRTPVFVYVKAILASDEFRGLEERQTDAKRFAELTRVCTAEDIRKAYRLLMHREAEAASTFERHEGKTGVWDFCRGLVESEECQALWMSVEP